MALTRKLKFAKANAKLKKLELATGKKVYAFSTLSGHSCPYAKDCLSKAVKTRSGTKVVDGKHTKFRCFSASQEAQYPSVYQHREYNANLLKQDSTIDRKVKRILFSIPKDAEIIRVHVGGDFPDSKTFDAWMKTAELRPDLIIYAYTKSLPFWVERKNDIPDNFVLTASYGGWKDKLIEEHNLRYSKVVFSFDEAKQLGLPIDYDDEIAALPSRKNESFLLILHGHQMANSEASRAIQQLKKDGWTGYNNKND